MNKGRILVVEDDKIIALEIKERLADFGYSVIAMVKTGYLAIEQAIVNKPDLILMDVSLEGEIDGIVTAERIRKVVDIPIIYLTALADDETLNRAKFTMPYGYIVKPLDERELKSAIDKHKTERILTDSESRYKAIVRSLEAELYLVDENRKIIFSNKPSGEGTELQDVNKSCYKTIFTRNIVCDDCSMDLVKEGEIKKSEMYDEKKKQWYSVVTSPLILSDGRFCNQHLVFNITDQKETENKLKKLVEEKNLLLREVNHRAKNNMQMMLSLLKLQQENDISAEATHNLKTFEQRVKSMMLIHEGLDMNTGGGNISLKKYASKLTDNLSKAYDFNNRKIKINLDVSDIILPTELAVPCGLIINELLTNSIKHAFPESTEGTISLKISSAGGNCELVVKDDGIGIQKSGNNKKYSGLGLQIVHKLVSQLSGEIEVLNKTGMEYRINIKTAQKNAA